MTILETQQIPVFNFRKFAPKKFCFQIISLAVISFSYRRSLVPQLFNSLSLHYTGDNFLAVK